MQNTQLEFLCYLIDQRNHRHLYQYMVKHESKDSYLGYLLRWFLHHHRCRHSCCLQYVVLWQPCDVADVPVRLRVHVCLYLYVCFQSKQGSVLVCNRNLRVIPGMVVSPGTDRIRKGYYEPGAPRIPLDTDYPSCSSMVIRRISVFEDKKIIFSSNIELKRYHPRVLMSGQTSRCLRHNIYIPFSFKVTVSVIKREQK